MAVKEQIYLSLGNLAAIWDRVKELVADLRSSTIPLSEKGEPGGVATLGSDGTISSDAIPDDVHDVTVLGGMDGLPPASGSLIDGAPYYDPSTMRIVSRLMPVGSPGETPSTRRLYVNRKDGRLYIFSAGKGMVEVGFKRPVRVASEEELERMVTAGETVDGQLYYTVEDD